MGSVKTSAQPATGLRQSLGPWQVGLYGLGSMLGAGIYALIGKVAGTLGNATWMAFAAAMVAALLTGLSYACVGSRYPRAAGAAYVTQRALGWPLLSYTVGLAVAMSGLTSMATGAQAVVAQLQLLGGFSLGPLGVKFAAIGLVAMVGLLLCRGIRESMWVNILCTVVEAAGLLFIIAVGLHFWGRVDYFETPTLAHTVGGPATATAGSGLGLVLILQASVLTFFSFIGFEDILNVSEEVKNPRRNVPLGLVGAMVVATLIYLAVAITAVSVVPWPELAASGAPLMEVARRAAPWFVGIGPVYLVITIFAVGNTALLNYLMGSRLLYGMSRQGLMPRRLSWIHPRRQTPQVAIAVLFGVVSGLIFVGGIKQLGEATVLLLLLAFTAVNLSLLILKRRPTEPRGGFEVPAVVPLLGVLVCLTLLGVRLHLALTDPASRTAPLIALGVVAASIGLYFLLRPKNAVLEDDELPNQE